MSMPALLSREEIHERLQLIFPAGTPSRNYCTRLLAASTIFVALYVNAVEGTGVYFGPKHIYRFTGEQAALTDDASRLEYAAKIMRSGYSVPGTRWYQDNTREPIRDETLREGLVTLGAVTMKANVATTAGSPRFALTPAFAGLFDPALAGDRLIDAIDVWRKENLTAGALARIAVVRKGAATGGDHLLVTFPNGETQRMKPGPSSRITKAVIEVFAPAFLGDPAVLFVSESGNKVVARHDELAKSVGLNIESDRNLPDIILVDLAPPHPLLVFVEVVATDGPVNERRKTALLELVAKAGFPAEHVAFVTAYLDRSGSPFKKTVDSLAWGSYAWFASEPERLVIFSDETQGRLPR
jgi:hypothetical protein